MGTLFKNNGKVINQKFKIKFKKWPKMSLSVSIESLFFNNKQNIFGQFN